MFRDTVLPLGTVAT